MVNELYIFFFESKSRRMKTKAGVKNSIEFEQAQVFRDTGNVKDRSRLILLQDTHIQGGGGKKSSVGDLLGQFVVLSDSDKSIKMFAERLKFRKLVKNIDFWKLTSV